MLSNVEREKLVIDLYYNQRKNVRQIAQEVRISFRDIAAILKKVNDVGSKSGNGIVTMDNQQQQQIGNGSSQCVLMHINTFCYRLNLSETMFEVLSFACINIVKTAMIMGKYMLFKMADLSRETVHLISYDRCVFRHAPFRQLAYYFF